MSHKKEFIFRIEKNMLTNGVHVILQLFGNKVVFLLQKGEIETGKRNIEPLVN